jgi:desulfoferrodoxin-like iron-binding protein
MERRASERIQTTMNAQFFWDNIINCATVANLSENGMCFYTGIDLPVDSEVTVLLPVNKEDLKIPIKVRRNVRTQGLFHSIGVEILLTHKRYSDYINSIQWKPLAPIPVTHQKIKTFSCAVCRHIAFEEAPFNCPFCHSSIEHFEKTSHAINIPEDFENLSHFEKTHFPVLTAREEFGNVPGCGHIDVHIDIGEIEHTMKKSDSITFIDIYFDDLYIHKRCVTRFNFLCEKIKPAATVRFENITSGILTVINHCNAHGSWMAQAKL